MRPITISMLGLLGVLGCAESVETSSSSSSSDDCRACTNPDSDECAPCLGPPGSPSPAAPSLTNTVNQIAVTETELDFAIIGDTRPAVINDTAGYPTAIVTTIFDDLQTENPRPGFAVGTGDYQFSSTGGTQTGPQLDLYAQARTHFSNPVYPAMGNHECTGATKSNCGAGTANGTTKIYSAYLAKVLTPAGIHNPYYSLLVKPPSNAWSAKVVFIAANAWTSAQSTWLDSVLAQPTTYTFIVRHESSKATTAPGVTPSAAIIAAHPYTMLIVGHDHTYKRLSQKEVIVGNGGAPLTTGSAYGYGIVSRRSDGAIQLTFYNYKTHAIMDSFAVKADGSKATSTPPPSGTFALTPNPASVSSSGASATSAISLTSSSGYSGTAMLSAADVPSGAQASFASSQLGANQSTTLTLSPGVATPGSYTIKISGVSGTETETTDVAWTVAATSTCAHDVCATGGKLASSCVSCATEICAKDSYCCSTSWDATCVAEVGTICGETCN